MSKWREKEWRIPRKGEVVKDTDGNLGIVTRSQGTFTQRSLYVSNVSGTEIYTNEPAEGFSVVELDVAKNFHIEKLALKGFSEGALCTLVNDDVPLEIIHIEWNPVRAVPVLWLKDLRKFDDNILKTDNEFILSTFDLNFPPIETIFSFSDSGLKWRLEVNLIEVNRPGWASVGSPWEFKEKQDALDEVENWKSRLKVRRVSSVINSNWKISFPCWTVDCLFQEKFFLLRVKKIESSIGFPCYFPTALHAATALKIIPQEDWQKVFISSQDPLF